MTFDITELNVSRETLERLDVYEDLLRKWNPKINLVARSTLDDLRTRHIKDSAQIWSVAPQNATTWVDLGSGGGFPGLVIAILAHELNPNLHMTLVESDQRKCSFLRTVLRQTGVSGMVIAKRIEDIDPMEADIISARALADLTKLLGFAERHLKANGTCIFPKGSRWKKEVEGARKSWSFNLDQVRSVTESNATILKIKDISYDRPDTHV